MFLCLSMMMLMYKEVCNKRLTQIMFSFLVVFVCAMAGFKQFLRPSWLRNILSWQRKDLLGCFPLPNDVAEMWEETYGDGGVLDIKRQNNYGMKKTHKCATHFSTVSISFIGIYLRYVMEFCSDTLFDIDNRN